MQFCKHLFVSSTCVKLKLGAFNSPLLDRGLNLVTIFMASSLIFQQGRILKSFRFSSDHSSLAPWATWSITTCLVSRWNIVFTSELTLVWWENFRIISVRWCHECCHGEVAPNMLKQAERPCSSPSNLGICASKHAPAVKTAWGGRKLQWSSIVFNSPVSQHRRKVVHCSVPRFHHLCPQPKSPLLYFYSGGQPA